MRRIWYQVLTLGCASGAIFTACGDNSAGTTMSTTSTTSTTSTGTGGSGGCADASSCPASTNECEVPSCTAGMCDFTAAPAGTLTAMQMPGDCKKKVCDGMGGITTANDDADLPTPPTMCLVASCSGGTSKLDPAATGTACSDNGGHLCDGAGKCVECLASTDCASGVCQANACVPASCTDSTLNGGETDIDCGGAMCNPCANGKICTMASDCQSGVCTGGTCAVPTCMDTVKNAMETDVDCGGPTCTPCVNGKKCLMASDCSSMICAGNPLTCQAPSCTDGLKNQNETDVDCGGLCTQKCGPGKLCSMNTDCTGGLCTGGTCAATCTDGVKNNAETDVDCGGGTCNACALGKMCTQPSDCASTICTNGVCSQLNGCDPSNTVDMGGAGVISFGGTSYTPPCIKVWPTGQVTFNGTFMFHPFQGGTVAGGVATPAATGPFATPVSTGTTKTYTNLAAGTYPYYCTAHYPFGMYGTVFVQ